MTTPTDLQQAQPNGPSGAQPPDGIAGNVHYIGSTYPWADHQTVALAAAAVPAGDTSTIDKTMASIQKSLTDTWDGVVHSFSDPVLAQKPSTGMKVQQFVSGNLGQMPIAGGSIAQYQQAMQAQGLGQGLAADGAWTPAWQAQNSQMLNELKSNQLAGQRTGSVKTSKAAHGIFHAISPTGIFDAVSGFVKSIPGDTRNLVADVGSGIINVPHEVGQALTTNPFGGDPGFKKFADAARAGDTAYLQAHSGMQNTALASKFGAAVSNIGAKNKITPEQYNEVEVHRALSDLNTILSLTGVGGLAKGSIKAIGENVARGVLDTAPAAFTRTAVNATAAGAAELQRTPGLIARTLWAARTPDQIAAEQQVAPRLLGQKWVNNVPVLGRLAPLPQKLAEGWSYGVRTTLARPYALPIVRATGQAFGRGQLAGLALHGDALLTPGTDQSKAIEGDHTADTLNQAWDAAQRKVIGVAPLDMNLLQGVLHAPVGDLSGAVGGFSRQIVRGFDDSLGQRNVQQSFERALGMNDSQLLKHAGGDRAWLDTWMHQETVKYAGDLWAQDQVTRTPLVPHTPNWENAVGALRHQFWQNSVQDDTFANRAVAQMLDNDVNGEQFTHRIRADWQKITDDPKAYLQGSLADLMNGTSLMQQGHLDGHWDYLITPQDRRIVRNAADAFDHDSTGTLGDAEPASTRRAYVAQGNGIVKAIGTQVAQARKLAAQRVKAAEQARQTALTATYETAKEARAAKVGAANTLREAKIKQVAVEEHAANRSYTKMVSAARGVQVHPLHPQVTRIQSLHSHLIDTLRTTHGLDTHEHVAAALGAHANHDLLIADAAREVARAQKLVDRGEPGADRILAGAQERQAQVAARAETTAGGVNFHDLYTQAHGAPLPKPADFGNHATRVSLNPRLPGAIGMRNLKKTVSMQAGMNQATVFERAFAAAKTPEETAALTGEVRKYLFENFDMASPEIGVYDQAPQKLVNLLRDRAAHLGADLVMDHNAPQGAKDWLKSLNDANYHPVIGQHVGHQYDGSLPNLENIAGGRSLQRRIIEKLGLNPLGVRDQDIGRAQRQSEITAVGNRLRESDKARLATAQINAKTIVDFIHSPGVLTRKEPGAALVNATQRAVDAFTENAGVNRSAVDALMASEDMTRPEALAAMKTEAHQIVNPRDISTKQLRAALYKTQEVTNPDGSTWTWQGLDPRLPEQKEAANLIIQGLRDGQRLPGYMMGWQAIENWGRAGFGFLGNVATRAPGSNFLTNVAGWPNGLLRLRNSLRFNLNPLFAARLVTKTKLKMNLEGLQYHFDALHHLGPDAAAAMRDTKRIIGDINDEATNADLLAQKAGMWGVFHRDWTKADAVRQLQAQGKSDDEIRAKINRMFKYGPEDGSGTSAFERSVNTIFFPFSFEKTVLRNTGQYLLEHPGQSLILSAAINEYRKYDQNGQVGQWVHDHAPILEELNQLNAFSHGISPGEFGGINRQLLNLFLPQSWGGSHNTANMQKMLPVFTNFNKLLKSVGDQSDVLRSVSDNAMQYLQAPGARDPLTPYRPMETNAAQQYQAGRLRAQFILALGPILQSGQQQNWPVSSKLPATVSGQPINKTSISYLVKKFYPAYDPAASKVRFDKEQVKLNNFINAQPPKEADLLLAFNKAASVVAGHLANDDYDAATQAQVQGAFQQTAQAVAKVDPAFYRFYNDFWSWDLGPLETVPKVGG